MLAERQVFEDKIGGARAEEDDDPTDQVPEEGAHWPQNLTAQSQVENMEVVRFTIVGSFEEAK